MRRTQEGINIAIELTQKEKADIVDYIIELEKVHDGKPVTVKGWGSVGFSSAKDFAFVRMMSRMEVDSKERYIAKWRLEQLTPLIKELYDYALEAKDTPFLGILNQKIQGILNKPGINIIREAFYPEPQESQQLRKGEP